MSANVRPSLGHYTRPPTPVGSRSPSDSGQRQRNAQCALEAGRAYAYPQAQKLRGRLLGRTVAPAGGLPESIGGRWAKVSTRGTSHVAE